MSVAKVIEITSESAQSFDDAIRKGVKKASETVSNIKGAWVKDQEVRVDGGNVVAYQVKLKITFLVS